MAETITLDTTKRRKSFRLVSNSGVFNVTLPQAITGTIDISIETGEDGNATAAATQNNQPIEATFERIDVVAQ